MNLDYVLLIFGAFNCFLSFGVLAIQLLLVKALTDTLKLMN